MWYKWDKERDIQICVLLFIYTFSYLFFECFSYKKKRKTQKRNSKKSKRSILNGIFLTLFSFVLSCIETKKIYIAYFFWILHKTTQLFIYYNHSNQEYEWLTMTEKRGNNRRNCKNKEMAKINQTMSYKKYFFEK